MAWTDSFVAMALEFVLALDYNHKGRVDGACLSFPGKRVSFHSVHNDQ